MLQLVLLSLAQLGATDIDAALAPPVPALAPFEPVVVSDPRGAQNALPPARVWHAPESASTLRAARAGALDAAATSAPRGLRAAAADVVFTDDDDGRVWARGLDYRAAFDRAGFVFLPVFGCDAPHEFPVAFSLRRATLGGAALALGVSEVARKGDHVTLAHPALREHYALSREAIEQTFVFDTLAGSGDLMLEIAVSTKLFVDARGDSLAFVHESLGHVDYGRAYVFDAAGRHAEIERVWEGDHIALRVPAEFLADATLPVTVDPLISAWVASSDVDDEARPDVCYDGRLDQYWVTWSERTSATNADSYVTSFDVAGVQGDIVAVEISSDSWADSKIGYHYGSHRVMVVARVDASGVVARLRGQTIDCATRFRIGGQFNISPVTPPTVEHDVAGNNWDSLVNSFCAIVWTAEVAPGDRDVYVTGHRHLGNPGFPIRHLADGPDDALHPAISETHGNGDIVGDWWTIAWTSDDDGDGLGSIAARRVLWNGSDVIGEGTFVVDAATDCARPSVTSRLDAEHPLAADRPAVVAYEREFPSPSGPNGLQRSVFAAVVVDGHAYAPSAISDLLEDVDGTLDQRRPTIATDGRGFMLAYLEAPHLAPSAPEAGVFVCTGHVVYTAAGAELALAERHLVLAPSTALREAPRIASAWDGRAGAITDEAAVVWATSTGPGIVTFEGSTLELPTTAGAPEVAVGRQFCDANPNGATSPHALTVSSWLSVIGTASATAMHSARCVDVTPNAAGYLLASRTTIDLNLPGNSVGRLCVLGAGRYISALQNSGAAGAFVTAVDPQSIPSPQGTVVAAAGETWHFQYWHRDTSPSGPTSNFSNACRVTFTP